MSDESATPPVPAQPVPEAPKQEPWEAALEDKLTGSSPAEVLSVMGKVRGWFANYCQKCGAYVEINPCKTCTAPAPPPPAPVVAHVEPPPPPAAPAILPQRPALDDQIRGGLWGVLVADAFGVPHEFKHAAKIPEGKDLAMVMPPTYKKTFPKVPYGTWSDDGALTLALADSIAKVGYLDPEDFGMRLMGWFTKGDFTPDRKAFDVGNTTQEAILRLTRGHSAKTAGLTADSSNGNGSLMRTLPVVLFHEGSDADLYDMAAAQSAVTHGHDIAMAACGVYCVAARHLMRGETAAKAFVEGLKLAHVKLDIPKVPTGSGYVLDTLAFAIGAARSGADYRTVVLSAIRLGADTDTTAAGAGGLIGARDGMSAIPVQWLQAMRGSVLASHVINGFVRKRTSR